MPWLALKWLFFNGSVNDHCLSHSFGGMPIMFSLDFNQLGPVLKNFIPTSMMLFAKRLKRISHSVGKRKHRLLCNPWSRREREMSTTSIYADATQAAIQQKQQKASHDKEMKKVKNFKPSDFSYQGAHLFSTFRRLHLKELQRSFKDAFLCNIIDPETPKIYKQILAEDLASEPDWLFAPVLVATNQEQINIT